MQHAIGDHALLADGRTAALLDPDGNVAWLCWPRVDSPPLLLSILDEDRGGCFTLRPRDAPSSTQRAYHHSSLVLRTTWALDGGHLTVDEALALGDRPALLRRARAIGRDVDVEVSYRGSVEAGGGGAAIEVHGETLEVAAAGGLCIDSCGPWIVRDGPAVSNFTVPAGEERNVVLRARDGLGVTGIDDTISDWRARLSPSTLEPSALAASLMDEAVFRGLATASVCVLLGLLQDGGGIVAAPTTSLPQWPVSARTWDYRYCWMRDASLAGVALVHAGHVDAAHRLGAFLGGAVLEHGPRPVFRVDGGLPPPEIERTDLAGYRGARPVRFGNGAAAQVQLDAPAELMELAWALAAHDHLPVSLASAATVCAGWMSDHWRDPDHGIWEIRGPARHYTHSRVMACVALRGAAALVGRGVLRGDAAAWLGAADALQREVAPARSGALELHAAGGGADAALSLLAHIGFLPPRDAVNLRTLQLIRERLDRRGLLERYEGRPDAIPDPCFPFIFPTFWMAEAADAPGLDAAHHFRAAVDARGPFDLFGEVADPEDSSPQGNYPQVQSHAAFLMCALAGYPQARSAQGNSSPRS